MGANNTITTASSSSSGAPRRPTSFFNSKYLFISGSLVSTCSALLIHSCFTVKQLDVPRLEKYFLLVGVTHERKPQWNGWLE